MKNDFNKNHPERLDDEVFVANADDEINPQRGITSYRAIGWTTKRRGGIAYNANGKPFRGNGHKSFPVFVKQREIKAEEDGEEILKELLP